MMLGVIGDFDPKAMRKTIEKAFASWPKGPAFTVAKIPYRSDAEPGRVLHREARRHAGQHRDGPLGIEQKNPDYFAVAGA